MAVKHQLSENEVEEILVEEENKLHLTLFDPSLVAFAGQLKAGRGLTIVGGICVASDQPFFDGGLFSSGRTNAMTHAHIGHAD